MLEVRAFRAVLTAVDIEVDVQTIGGLEAQLRAPSVDIDLTVLLAARTVEHMTLTLLDTEHRQPARDRIRQTTTDGGLVLEPVEAAEGAFDMGVGLLRRLARDVVDRAAVGVAAIESALRPLEDLEPLHVEQLQTHQGDRRQVDLVDIEADTRLAVGLEVVHADATDGGHGHRVAPDIFDVEVGRLRRDLRDIRPATRCQIIGGECRDGDTDILELLGTLLGGDDHLFEPDVLRSGDGTDSEQGQHDPQCPAEHPRQGTFFMRFHLGLLIDS